MGSALIRYRGCFLKKGCLLAIGCYSLLEKYRAGNYLFTNDSFLLQKAVKRKLSDSADPEDASTSSPKKICKGEHSNSDDHKDSTSEKCNYQKLLRKTEKAVGCTYWKNGWRSHLCACETCMVMFNFINI